MTQPDRRTALSCLAALVVLLAAAPRPDSAVAQLAAVRDAADPTGPLVAAVALAAWALSLWLVATAALVLAGRAPGLVGRAAIAVGRRVAPAAVRRTLEVALGLTVTVTGLALPASASPGAAASAPAGTAAALPSLDWPVPEPAAPPPPAAEPAAPEQPGPAAPPVVVAPGDSLWALAAAHLERTGSAPPTARQVAAAWPQWWSTNREAVGDDPDLIRPGTVLRPPGS